MRTSFEIEKIQGTIMDNQQELKNALEIKNLNFYYGSFQGLKNINLNIA